MSHFELLVFSTDERFAREAVEAGIDGVVIDWETRGKARRQASADTEINHDTPEDLRRIRAATAAPIVCRINGVGGTTAVEVEEALAGGATEILVPMVRSVEEVEVVLDLVNRRCGVGILVETMAAVDLAPSLGRLPLSRAYVGLNDLAIDRGSPNLFDAVADGTVERVRRAFDAPFGFGGLTLPERGRPVPCRLLMGELARLACAFSFLRRSFHRDRRDLPLDLVVRDIRDGLAAAARRSATEVADDRAALVAAIDGAVDALRQ